MNTSFCVLKRLTREDNVQSFDCGSNEWDIEVADFLKEDALTQQKMGLNVTWLCQRADELIGYTTLVSSTLRVEEPSGWKVRLGLGQIARKDVPCILVAQFGVVSSFQRQGIGSFILSWVRGAALKSDFGVKLLTLHADRRNTVGRKFWESRGFVNFPPEGSDKLLFMVYDLYG